MLLQLLLRLEPPLLPLLAGPDVGVEPRGDFGLLGMKVRALPIAGVGNGSPSFPFACLTIAIHADNLRLRRVFEGPLDEAPATAAEKDSHELTVFLGDNVARLQRARGQIGGVHE